MDPDVFQRGEEGSYPQKTVPRRSRSSVQPVCAAQSVNVFLENHPQLTQHLNRLKSIPHSATFSRRSLQHKWLTSFLKKKSPDLTNKKIEFLNIVLSLKNVPL